MSWIKCTDIMPDEDTDCVLVYDANYGMLIASMWIGARGDTCWTEKQTGCGCCAAVLQPTHWKHLPPKPKDLP